MSRSLYLAAIEGNSGKSAVALGLVDQLVRLGGRIGVFRPIVRTRGSDPLVELLLDHTRSVQDPATATGVSYDDLHADAESALGEIVERFHVVADAHDLVLVVGSDYSDVPVPTEFSVNARIAANLGSTMVLVLPAAQRCAVEVARAARLSVGAASESHAIVGGVIVNQVPGGQEDDYADVVSRELDPISTFTLADSPMLAAPTLADLRTALGGELIHGDPAMLGREAVGFVVAAMTLPHVLDRLTECGVIVVPGDREEIVVGTLLAHRATTFPSIAGIVLNGGFELSPQIKRLIEGIDDHLPLITSPHGTMKTAAVLHETRGSITPGSTRKIETAVTMVRERVDAAALIDGIHLDAAHVVTPLMFEHNLIERARPVDAHIVLPEGTEPRILQAASIVRQRRIARITVLGENTAVRAVAGRIGVDLGDITIVDPATSQWRGDFATEFARLRAHKGVTRDAALDIMRDPSYFGTMMAHRGLADAMVSGAVTTTAATVRPALEVIRTAPGVGVVSSVFFMALADQVLVYGDCAINPDPDAAQLADIAISSAETAAQFGIEPRVAMLSYSTGSSGSGADVEKVRAATSMVRERRPDLLVEGPVQYDAAVDSAVAATKLEGSEVAGRATVLIFPDLNTGNNTYKAVQRSAQAVAIGPVLQGLAKPVNDLSRGALVRDIVNTIAITAVQVGAAAQERAQ